VLENDKPILIYTTLSSESDARQLGRALIERGLAACVNILPGMTSIFRWDGELQQEREVVMIVKSRAKLTQPLLAAAEELHPYETPALLVIPISEAATGFASWITAQTTADDS
jgi:periplasmic divalent cation tolerance protein